MHADRLNRVMLILFALILIAAGAAGGAASVGVFGRSVKHHDLSRNRVGAYIGQHGDWLWPAAALAALIIALLALRWLLALLFSTDRAGDLTIRGGGGAGKTTLVPGAVSNAVVDEIKGYPGVDQARARVIGDADDAQLVVAATLRESADLARLRRRIERGALTHARTALGKPELPIQLDLTVTTRSSTRVS